MSEAVLDLVLPHRFSLRRHLGSGGMGAVFEALDSKTGARVALKTLHASNPEALLFLKNEFRSLQDVVHPNLVNLLELIEDSGRFFVAMELVEGVDFLSWARPGDAPRQAPGMSETRRVALPEAQANSEPAPASKRRAIAHQDDARLRTALVQLAAGLCALHDSGKLHRDVKPSNILVTESGRVVLLDFGLAAELGPSGTPSAAPGMGTRAFMAPEQAAGQRVSAAADWFSVGVVLYLTLTGELPFDGAGIERRRVEGRYKPVQDLAPFAPDDLCALCHALLELDPELRPSGQRVLELLGGAKPDFVRPVSAQSVFVGRAAELAALHVAALASRNHAVSSFVVGDSGVGKSTLVREALSRLDATRALVLSGRCYERELVPFKALDGIVDALSLHLLELAPEALQRLLPARAPILARVFPVLARVPGFGTSLVADSQDPLELRALAFSALRELFSALAEDAPVLLFIDDLQWADQDSHLLLSDLLREPASPKLCLVATARPPALGAPDRIQALAARLGDVRRIALTPLDQRDALRLAESVIGSSGSAELAGAIALESAGHPLFVVTMAQHASSTGARAIGSIHLDDALFARVESIAAPARRLLEFVAVADTPLHAELAIRLTGSDHELFAANAHALRVARLTRSTTNDIDARIEPYHDRIRETVLARLDVEARRACHLRLAEVLDGTGLAERDPQALVRHLEGAGLVTRAAHQAELAAARAQDAFAFDQAAELYRTALRLGSFAPNALRDLNLRLAEALTNAGRAAEAARAYLACVDGSSSEEQLLYRRLAANRMLRSGHLEEGLRILSDVLSVLGDHLPSQREALIKRLWHRFRPRWRGLSWTERPASAIAPGTLQRIDAYHAVGVSLSLIDPIRGGAFEARALRLALDAGERNRLAEVLVMESGYRGAISASGRAAARPLLLEVASIIARTRDPYHAAILPMIEGHLSIQAGEFGLAEATLSRVLPQLRALPGTYFEQAFCHCFRLICLRNRGQLAELQAGFFDWVRDAERRGDRFSEASLRFNLNNIWLARDEPEQAIADLERVTWVDSRDGYHVQHWYEQHARAEIALYAADSAAGLVCFREVLSHLSRSFIMRMRLHRSVARWILARLILASQAGSGASRGSLREVTRLAKDLRREREPFTTCWAFLLDAAVACQRGQLERARSALSEAIASAKIADLPHCAASARLRLAALCEGEASRGPLAEGRAWFEAQQIRNPERMLDVWAPGFFGPVNANQARLLRLAR
ncbi:MAG: protein kinase [Polyangiaceae bacterium]